MIEKDVLIAARPDQSLQIYEALENQHKISFNFITFKVIPRWINKRLKIKKLKGVGEHVSIAYWGTFKHLAKRRFHFGFAKNWSDSCILDGKIRRNLFSSHYKIIHFWPEHCGGGVIQKYAIKHPEVFIIADIHMPHPAVVFREMKSIYEKNGIDSTHSDLARLSEEQKDYVKGVDNILVPSSYVAETYKKLYPKKNYFVVPYGVRISNMYNKSYKDVVTNFVYVGIISLEKGCDLLFNSFINKPYLNLHIFGSFLASQQHIFVSYRSYPNIHFHGFVPKTEIQEKIKGLDVGIHLSRFDAYSLAVGEVIGTGLPVIVSDHTGNKEDVSKYGLGLVTSLDERSINEAIEKICKSGYYNSCVDNIDSFIHNKVSSYGDNMIDFYTEQIELMKSQQR